MRRRQPVGTKYDHELDAKLTRNQNALLDTLTTPHVRLPERGGGQYKITASVAAYTPDEQPTQGDGRIVWNRAYQFQPHGPTYLDPVPDPTEAMQ